MMFERAYRAAREGRGSRATACAVAALLPAEEEGRLATLHALSVLDTPPSDDLDAIVASAAAFFDAPTALVTLVDRDRQWFKARFGFHAAETPRVVSFCAHAVAARDLLVVPDAACDPRFAANPLVTGAPFIRFYAGAPLAVGDHAVGALCVIDSKRREPLSLHERRALTGLARRAAEKLVAHPNA